MLSRILATLRSQAANVITLFRLALAFVAIGLAVEPDFTPRAIATLLVVVAVALDSADGWAARRFAITSRLGAALDIVADRVAECVWWITLSVLGSVPLWVPLVVVSRGILTDSLRAIGYERGLTAFEGQLKSRFAQSLVASRLSRGLYGGLKLTTFALLFGIHAVAAWPGGIAAALPLARSIAVAMAGLVAIFCVVRGLPVLIESRRLVTS